MSRAHVQLPSSALPKRPVASFPKRTVALCRVDGSMILIDAIRESCCAFAGEIPEHIPLYIQTLHNIGMAGGAIDDAIKRYDHTPWVEALLLWTKLYLGLHHFKVSS